MLILVCGWRRGQARIIRLGLHYEATSTACSTGSSFRPCGFIVADAKAKLGQRGTQASKAKAAGSPVMADPQRLLLICVLPEGNVNALGVAGEGLVHQQQESCPGGPLQGCCGRPEDVV